MQARDKAFEVISGVPSKYPYTLFDSYAYLHDRAHKVSSELILQVQVELGTNDQGTSGIAQLIIPEKSGISSFPDEYGALTVRDEFVQSYEEGDKRADLTPGETNTFFFNAYEKDGEFHYLKEIGNENSIEYPNIKTVNRIMLISSIISICILVLASFFSLLFK